MNNKPITPNATPFLFDNSEVRTAIGPDGEPWFCAKDVCAALDIQWSGRGNTLRSMPEDWVMVSYHETIKGERETVFLSEPAVYQLVFRSSKPSAQAFARWIYAEVLPALRRQGFYGEIKHKDRLAYSKHILALTQRLGREHDAFVRGVVIGELREMCRLTGQRMPDQSLLGRFTGLF